MHRLADDHLNMLDVCVVWGSNTSSAQLGKPDFWNGVFTCNVKTRDQAAWESFDMYQLSNNHLISDDDFIISRAVFVLPQALQVASALTRMVEQECYDY